MVNVFSIVDIVDHALEIAVNCGVTVYDSAYLALADMLRYKLVSFDRELERKLKNRSRRENTHSSTIKEISVYSSPQDVLKHEDLKYWGL